MARARKRQTGLLEAATMALARGHHREMAELIREAWRETREPELARVYELLIREFARPPLAGRDAAERAASWRERAEHADDPLELPVLLAEPWDGELDERERLELLERWSPDPLLAAALARRLRIPLAPAATEVKRRSIALLGAQADPRQLSTLEWLCAEPFLPAQVRGQARRAHAKLAEVAITRLREHERAALTKLERRSRARRDLEARSAELLAAVHAAPDLDEPRLVYADWLGALGDPRGEFITLQIERARTGGPASSRERELLERHAAQWSGILHGVLGRGARVFERGFLAAASVEVANLDGEVVDTGEWATLRILDGHVSDALARRGSLDHLRELYGFLQLDRFVALRADNRLAAVEVYECSLADPNLPLDVPLGLRALLVRRALDDALLELAAAPAIDGLEQLGVYYSVGATPAADHRERASARHRYELLRARLPPQVRRLQLVDGETARASRPLGWTLTFERDEIGAFAILRLDWRTPPHRPLAGEAVEQLHGLLDSLGSAPLRRLALGRCVEPERTSVAGLLADFASALGCEFVDLDDPSARGSVLR